MSHYRVRREGMEFPVAGLEALQRLVREGTLGPRDRVHSPTGECWQPAQELPELAEVFAALEREHASRKRRKRPRASLLPSGGLGPVAPTTAAPPGEPLFEIPPDLEGPSMELAGARGDEEADTDPELGAPPVATDPPPSPDEASQGRVVSFPEEEVQRAAIRTLPPFGTSLDPDQAKAAMQDPGAFLRSASSPAPGQQPRPVRPSLILMTLLVGVVAAVIAVSYFQHNANMYQARKSSVTGSRSQPTESAGAGPSSQQPDAAPVFGAPRTGPVEPTADALYEEMELSLRNRMVTGCSTIAKEDDLDTALRVELSRLGVQAYSMHAPVLTWGGRKGDMPLAVEIKIWYQGHPGELDRELGAIGLVVGKYAQQYSLDVRAFEVTVRDASGQARVRTLDPTQARQFYLRRSSLLEFLTGEGP